MICVNWAGLPCELDKLWNICKKHGIKLIQDAAHSFGASYDGKQVCHFADYTCYSFQAIKHITSGDGGAIVINTSLDDFNRAKKLKWFGIDRESTKDEKGEWKGQRWEVDIEEAGYKFHMNNLTAAIGISQFPFMKDLINKHIKNGKRYQNLFKHTKIKPLSYPEKADPSYWVYTVILPECVNRDLVLQELNDKQINAGLVHVPNHNYSCFKESFVELKETDYFYKHQLSLPCGWWLNEDDITHIASTLIDIINA